MYNSAASCGARNVKQRCLMSNKRAALYVRVSTDAQTVENQIRELRQVAGRRGWHVVEVYSDAGISGAKGRNGRPGLDSILKDASRRKFDIVMAWAIDRLGRSLIDLLNTIPTPGSLRNRQRYALPANCFCSGRFPLINLHFATDLSFTHS